MKEILIVAVVGPTASGKTRLGVELALALDGEVVSADSMQIYKGMDIATAKPTAAEMRGVAHHLIGFADPREEYSVARFVQDAASTIAGIASRGRLPILVGGTGLYISSLLDGLRFADEQRDPALRAELYALAAERGNEAMLSMLGQIDPDYARTLHPNNLGRILRAIELYRATGVTMSEQCRHSRASPSPYVPVMVGLDFADRQNLYRRINARVDDMLSRGLVEEAKEFFAQNGGKTAAQAIGIKELLPFLRGEIGLEQCVERIKRETRRYAKRQLTWFRRDGRVFWLMADQTDAQSLPRSALAIVEDFMLREGNRT